MHITSLYTVLVLCLGAYVSSVLASARPHQWDSHSFSGWWNPGSKGPAPVATLHYDYIVVGSGPGGAPLAARLGLAGYEVLVIEAGSDEAPIDVNIQVPYLNAKASEDPSISWKFLVCSAPLDVTTRANILG
jgi:hypothetical protein